MVYCYENLTKPKRYIQYNDLVFLGRKSIDEQSESTSLRVSKTPRTFAHGSYVANRGEKLLIGDNTISLKIALRTDKWNEEHVQAHYEFIMEQLMTPGKLWAINTGYQLVWCHAYVTSIQNAKEWVVTDDDYLVFKVEFDNPDGVWYKADESRTYLDNYDHCDFISMKANCLGQTQWCCSEPLQCTDFCACCDDKCAEMCDMVDMCEMQHDTKFYEDFFELCNSKWRVVYNCELAKKRGKSLKDMYKHTVCDGCLNGVLSGKFQSTTALESHKWSLALMGNFEDPVIRLNDKEITLFGKFSGVVTIDYTGKIKYAKSWECIEYSWEDVSLNSLKLCADMPYIKKGTNNISVTGVQDFACIYINYESVTM